MDYVEAFQNLKTNNKYSRKSPHKAVLLLAIIDMFESCELTDNVIKYDDALKSAFVKMWNKVLPNEATFLSGLCRVKDSGISFLLEARKIYLLFSRIAM